MKHVYTVLGMTYKLELSTRPAKALGDHALWDIAEGQLAEALDEFAGVGKWSVNAGDGAFYGPKIDIKVFDALERIHQCATVQLDFQLPIRFDLQYKAKEESEGDKEKGGEKEKADKASSFARPVMVHRAMLGSVERMAAVLAEHWCVCIHFGVCHYYVCTDNKDDDTIDGRDCIWLPQLLIYLFLIYVHLIRGGKWPFWVSPRQVCVVPVDPKFYDYAFEVQAQIHAAGETRALRS